VTVQTGDSVPAEGFAWSRQDNFGKGPVFNAGPAGQDFYFAAKSQVALAAPALNGAGSAFVRWLRDGLPFAGNSNAAIALNDGFPRIPSTGAVYTAEYASVAPTRVISLSGDLAFGTVAVGSWAQRTLTISNSGNSALTVSNISYPDGFSGNWSGTVPPDGAQEVTVTFSPGSAGAYGGDVTVSADPTSGVNTMAISGTGTAPSPALCVSALASRDKIVIAWPSSFGGFSLEYTTDLRATNWIPDPAVPVLVEGNYTVTNPLTAGNRFYRLRK
jgi:hypothetical protein